jgi:hypothetical protein
VKGWYEVKVRGTLGNAENSVRVMTILRREVGWSSEGTELAADKWHRKKVSDSDLKGIRGRR